MRHWQTNCRGTGGHHILVRKRPRTAAPAEAQAILIAGPFGTRDARRLRKRTRRRPGGTPANRSARACLVYSKLPFGGPDAVLAYLSRYTHRVAIANSRLIAFDGERVTFKWKDYRAKASARYKLMTLDADEFIRRFLIHVLPDGFHRIRHYGLFANANRANNIALARRFLGVPDPARSNQASDNIENAHEDEERSACPCWAGG